MDYDGYNSKAWSSSFNSSAQSHADTSDHVLGYDQSDASLGRTQPSTTSNASVSGGMKGLHEIMEEYPSKGAHESPCETTYYGADSAGSLASSLSVSPWDSASQTGATATQDDFAGTSQYGAPSGDVHANVGAQRPSFCGFCRTVIEGIGKKEWIRHMRSHCESISGRKLQCIFCKSLHEDLKRLADHLVSHIEDEVGRSPRSEMAPSMLSSTVYRGAGHQFSPNDTTRDARYEQVPTSHQGYDPVTPSYGDSGPSTQQWGAERHLSAGFSHHHSDDFSSHHESISTFRQPLPQSEYGQENRHQHYDGDSAYGLDDMEMDQSGNSSRHKRKEKGRKQKRDERRRA